MRLWLTCFLLFGILPCSGEDHQAAAPMVLYTSFEAEPPAPVMQSIREELDSIMSPVGVRFEWRSLAKVHNDEPAVELAIIHFKGHCDLSSGARPSPNPGPLGWTHVSDGAILRFSDIDCDGIRSFILRDLMMERADERDKLLGRAIARVLAHELYHMFANTRKHTTRGLGKANYLSHELVAEDLRFEKRDCVILRKGTAISNLESAANTLNRPPDAEQASR